MRKPILVIVITVIGIISSQAQTLPAKVKSNLDKNYSSAKFSVGNTNSNFRISLIRFGSSKSQVKPKLGKGTFTGTISQVDKSGNRVTGFWVESKKFMLMLDASSAVIAGGSLSKGTRVRVSYKNLENSEMDIGTAFSGKAVRVVVLKK